MAFPEVTLARDFIADVARGDGIGAALDSLGYIGPVKNLLGESPVIASFMEKYPNKFEAVNEYISGLEKLGIDISPAAKREAVTQVLEYNINTINQNPSFKNAYVSTIKKTVLGTSKPIDNSEPYKDLGRRLGANYLDLDNSLSQTVKNQLNIQFLDCVIGNGDEIILSVDPAKVSSDSYFKKEIEYLEQFGYVKTLGDDGLFRMVMT
jgi:hypothetical protein